MQFFLFGFVNGGLRRVLWIFQTSSEVRTVYIIEGALEPPETMDLGKD